MKYVLVLPKVSFVLILVNVTTVKAIMEATKTMID